MSVSMADFRKFLFGISPREATFDRRGFRASDAGARRRLEQVGHAFLHGYNSAIADDRAESLIEQLHLVEADLRGFAFEGAAMGLTLLDYLTPWQRNRWQVFLDGPGAAHVYMLHVGAGWALARLPWRPERAVRRMDPLLGWLAFDGIGFQAGYFDWKRFITGHALPTRFTSHARRVFDQGLGRSLWFVEGGDHARIPATIAAFPQERHADLWSGVGLACSYAGPVERTALQDLWQAAGPYRSGVAQGTAFAAKARQRAGNPAPQTDLACEVFCRMSADAAATITDSALVDLRSDGTGAAYEEWRRRIRAAFAEEKVTS